MNTWDERYGDADYYYGTRPNDFLAEQAGRIAPGGKVLCLAEGEGRNATYLAGLGLDVTAVDQSSVGLEKARRLASERGVALRTVLADLDQWPIEPDAWDAVVSIWCHLPRDLRARVHRQVVAGLHPGGLLILEAYTPDQLRFGTGGPKDANLMPTLVQLRSELQGLVFDVAVEREREVHEGRGHGGPSAVVQVLARRAQLEPDPGSAR
jgi:SAM-dependent methyltransferase